MNTEELGGTFLGRLFIRAMALIMESRLRYIFFGPKKILEAAGIRPGMKVLEVGCGTGFFTIPAGRMLGDGGSLTAIDMLPLSVEAVAEKVRQADLARIVNVVRGDALDTKLADESLDEVILFGVIPAPMLPMDKLMGEMSRVLRTGGRMAVWPTSWVHRDIVKSGRFSYVDRQNGVSNYQKVDKT